MEDTKIQDLENLVDELLKSHPREPKIKAYLKSAGIKDAKDPLERLDHVLQALNFNEPNKEFKE